MGYPDAGKSNYIFRLWLAIRDGKKRDLLPDGSPDEAEYLNTGVQTQLGGAFAGHTPAATQEFSRIPVISKGNKVKLILPDRPGEDWLRVYRERRWPEAWEKLVDANTSCLIFLRIHSKNNRSLIDWMTVQQAYGNRGNFARPSTAFEDVEPTQVVLVEWIQMLSMLYKRQTSEGVRPRIGIVLSAWDLLSQDDAALGPRGYMESEYGFLADFLESNSDRFEFEVFGVSLYGGDFKHQAAFKKDFLDGDPSKLGYVLRQSGATITESDDLTVPIMWALEDNSV
ncbi:hypothetical protein [Cupriavidus sp. Agwp_2]|uniref:TRAFAC clade GTPase domain-containing protein n=1 Tax=Cupriavidus sp. Agwp_2 TaxID=2897324 RepID=UPI003460EC1E